MYSIKVDNSLGFLLQGFAGKSFFSKNNKKNSRSINLAEVYFGKKYIYKYIFKLVSQILSLKKLRNEMNMTFYRIKVIATHHRPLLIVIKTSILPWPFV